MNSRFSGPGGDIVPHGNCNFIATHVRAAEAPEVRRHTFSSPVPVFSMLSFFNG